MNGSPRRRLTLGCIGFFTMVLPPACKKKQEAKPAPLEPPTLEFLGIENGSGDRFDVDSEQIEIECDRLLTVHLGPEGEVPGTIANWTLRPPNICTNLEQCGYLLVGAYDEEGNVLLSVEQAVASPLLDLSALDLSEIASFRATLIEGNTQEPFLEEDAPVVAELSVRVTSDCENMGGAGGNGPDPKGGVSPIGGDGGMGASPL